MRHIFQGLFKNIVFRSAALVIFKIFLHTLVFYRPAPYLIFKYLHKTTLSLYVQVYSVRYVNLLIGRSVVYI